ncbi:hypothetical protein M2146_001071 [Lachnospiraceae bacterium PF1-22]
MFKITAPHNDADYYIKVKNNPIIKKEDFIMEVKNYSVQLKDAGIKKITEKKELLEFFGKQKANDVWREPFLKELSLDTLNCGPILIESEKTRHKLDKCSDEAILETMNDTGLVLYAPGDVGISTYLVRDTACSSLADRFGLAGKSLVRSFKTQKDMYVNFANGGFKLWGNESGKMLIRDGKISAIHSKNYAILPTVNILEALHGCLYKDFPDWEMTLAEITHSISYIQYEFPEQKEEILHTLNRILSRHNHNSIDDAMPMIILTCSDTATSGVNIYTGLKYKNMIIRTGNVLRIRHYGDEKDALAEFKKNCEKIHALFKDSTDRLEKMETITMSYPVDALIHIAHDLGLSKKATYKVADDYGLTRANKETALNVYLLLWDIVEESMPEGVEAILKLQEQVSRASFFDFKEYDRSYSWENK